jgi:hypothetical protein
VAVRRGRRGPLLRYTLSESARVAIGLARVERGVWRGRTCARATRAARASRACIRYAQVASVTQDAAEGPNAKRLSRRRLAAGVYRVTFTARDAAGNVSGVHVIRFRLRR